MLQFSESKMRNEKLVVDQPVAQGRARIHLSMETICQAAYFFYPRKPVLNSEPEYLSALVPAQCAYRQELWLLPTYFGYFAVFRYFAFWLLEIAI